MGQPKKKYDYKGKLKGYKIEYTYKFCAVIKIIENLFWILSKILKVKCYVNFHNFLKCQNNF